MHAVVPTKDGSVYAAATLGRSRGSHPGLRVEDWSIRYLVAKDRQEAPVPLGLSGALHGEVHGLFGTRFPYRTALTST